MEKATEASEQVRAHAETLLTQVRKAIVDKLMSDPQLSGKTHEGRLTNDLGALMQELGKIAPGELSEAVKKAFPNLGEAHNLATTLLRELQLQNAALAKTVPQLYGISEGRVVVVPHGIHRLHQFGQTAEARITGHLPEVNGPLSLPRLVDPNRLLMEIRERVGETTSIRSSKAFESNTDHIREQLVKLGHYLGVKIHINAVLTVRQIEELTGKIEEIEQLFNLLSNPRSPQEKQNAEDEIHSNVTRVVSGLQEAIAVRMFHLKTHSLPQLSRLIGTVNPGILQKELAERLRAESKRALTQKVQPDPEAAHAYAVLRKYLLLNS